MLAAGKLIGEVIQLIGQAHTVEHLLGALGTHGLDEGLRDADNLAWKLALALKVPDRKAPNRPAILDTYGPERKPHAREFIELAVRMGHIIQVLDPEAAERRDAELLEQGLTFQFPRPALGAGYIICTSPPPAQTKRSVSV